MRKKREDPYDWENHKGVDSFEYLIWTGVAILEVAFFVFAYIMVTF